MPIEINGQIYYYTTDMCNETGISRSTLSRWIQKGVLKQIRKDRRGWRLFTEHELNSIQLEIEKIVIEEDHEETRQLENA